MKRLIVALACVALGCGGKVPQLSEQGKSFMKRFEQQMPNHKTPAFKQMCDEIEKLHDQKKMSDEEYKALHKVCGPGGEGQWDRATAGLKALTAAQSEKKSE